MKNIRNFSIIAHIDHGKSTLSDRIIQICGGLSDREMEAQVLDSMDLERERGITIKAQSVTLDYKASDGETYQLNFIDTPGHVDFSYEVSRSLAACEGALLVVDAGQGVEAQTLANCYTAMEMDLEVVPVLNKIDLPAADPERVAEEIEDIVGIDATDAVRCSAKTGVGVQDVLERLVRDIPPPEGDPEGPLQALIIDSWFDNYLGVVSLIRIKNGTLRKGDKVKVMSTGQTYNADRLGIFTPKQVDRTELKCGEVGWLVCAIKDIHGAPVGDTLTLARNPAEKALPGFKKVKPQVYAGLFPVSSDDYEAFRDALGKLSLNDASLFYEPESSSALGFGFRCGFLGLLHMDVVQERLEREFNLDLITTAPSVTYHVDLHDGTMKEVENPAEMPDTSSIKDIKEPYVKASIMVPNDYVGPVMELCQRKRGEFDTMEYLSETRVNVIYHIPLSEIIFDFFDKLKSSTHGYASLDYEIDDYRVSDLVKIDILLNGDKVDALSFIAHRDFAEERGREITTKLKKIIPRQNFEIPIQAAIGSKIIKAYRKDVTARIHTGDPDRRAKLLDKQKRGKKRMKAVGRVEVPQEAFMAVLKTDEEIDEKKK